MINDILILCSSSSTNSDTDSVILMYLCFFFTKLGYHVYMMNTEHDENMEELISSSKMIIPIITDSFKSDPICISALTHTLYFSKDMIPITCIANDHWLSSLSIKNSYLHNKSCIDFSDIYKVLYSSMIDEDIELWLVSEINQRISELLLLFPNE